VSRFEFKIQQASYCSLAAGTIKLLIIKPQMEIIQSLENEIIIGEQVK
jgi:hypothetical protein